MKKSKLRAVFNLPLIQFKPTGYVSDEYHITGIIVNSGNQKAIKYYQDGYTHFRILLPEENVVVGQPVKSFRIAEFEEYISNDNGKTWNSSGKKMNRAIQVK